MNMLAVNPRVKHNISNSMTFLQHVNEEVLLWPYNVFNAYHYSSVSKQTKISLFFSMFQTCYVVYISFIYAVPLKMIILHTKNMTS